jgi:hypothetical protein
MFGHREQEWISIFGVLVEVVELLVDGLMVLQEGQADLSKENFPLLQLHTLYLLEVVVQ